jgi:hypothetical protein
MRTLTIEVNDDGYARIEYPGISDLDALILVQAARIRLMEILSERGDADIVAKILEAGEDQE